MVVATSADSSEGGVGHGCVLSPLTLNSTDLPLALGFLPLKCPIAYSCVVTGEGGARQHATPHSCKTSHEQLPLAI